MIEKASAQLPYSDAWCKSEAVIFLLPGEMCCFAAQVNNLLAWIFRYISSEGKNSKGWTSTFFFNMYLRLCRFFHWEYSAEVFLVTKPKWVKEKLDSQSQEKKKKKTLLYSPPHHYQLPEVPTQHLLSLTLACPRWHHPLDKFSPPPKPVSGSSLPCSFMLLQTTSSAASFRWYFSLLCQLPSPLCQPMACS